MPFIELLAPPADDAIRAAVVQAVTEVVCQSFQAGPETVTLYFQDIRPQSYGHAGVLGPADPQRVFLKLHAFARSIEARRMAALMLTTRLAELYRLPEQVFAIYFFDRRKDEVAHGGKLSCDTDPD